MAQSLELQYIDESYQKLVQISGSYIADGTGSQINNLTVTASYATNALTASYALAAPSSSYAISASHSENSNSAISASHAIIADTAITANSATTAGFASIAATASYVAGANVDGTVASAVSASYALTASHLLGFVTSASYAESASQAENANTAISASWADVAGYANSVSGSNVTGSVEFSEFSNNTIVYGKNMTGTQIEKGTPLYFSASGVSGNVVGVYPADAGNPARMPAGGIAGETLTTPGGEGKVFLDGFLNRVDTSAFNSGDAVFVAVGGGYTNVKPTGSANLIQALGYIEAVDSTNGSGVIQGSGRANDVPNITEGYLWVGNGDGVATPTDSSSITTFAGLQNFDTISYDNTSSFTATRTNGGSQTITINTVPEAVNLTSGNKTHSGYINQQFSAPSVYSQNNLATISGVTYNSVSYPISELAFINYAPFGAQFENAFAYSVWDGFSYTGGSELLIAPQRFQFNFTPQGGAGNAGLMGMQPNGTDSTLLCYATELQLGQFRGVTINIGNRSGIAGRQTENLVVNAVTSSLTTDYNYETANVGHYSTGGSRGNVTTLTNGGGSGTTLSLNGGNFYTLNLATASTQLNLNTGDITAGYGQTFSIEVSNVGASNALTFDSNFKFVGGTAPVITSGGVDILTGITFGGTDVYITAVQNLV